MGPEMLYLQLGAALKRLYADFGPENVEAFACMDDATLGLRGVSTSALCELCHSSGTNWPALSFVINPNTSRRRDRLPS